MIPKFLTLETGKMVVPFTKMAKMGCGKADSGRWDTEAKQEFPLEHETSKETSRRQSDVGSGGQKRSLLDIYIHWGVISSLTACKALGTDEHVEGEEGLSHILKNSPHSEVPKRRRCLQRNKEQPVGTAEAKLGGNFKSRMENCAKATQRSSKTGWERIHWRQQHIGLE